SSPHMSRPSRRRERGGGEGAPPPPPRQTRGVWGPRPAAPASPTPTKTQAGKSKAAAVNIPAYLAWSDCEGCVPGSNNWVISGAHTVSGKPLLANDMHLPHRVPGVWYEVQLHAGDYNVEGFSLPGMPMITVGHNQRIAWGYTNLNPD